MLSISVNSVRGLAGYRPMGVKRHEAHPVIAAPDVSRGLRCSGGDAIY